MVNPRYVGFHKWWYPVLDGLWCKIPSKWIIGGTPFQETTISVKVNCCWRWLVHFTITIPSYFSASMYQTKVMFSLFRTTEIQQLVKSLEITANPWQILETHWTSLKKNWKQKEPETSPAFASSFWRLKSCASRFIASDPDENSDRDGYGGSLRYKNRKHWKT